ncbi:hypothetical protein J4466_05240 [Candidatus Pacearchaeota archaeon]|nr:hypothetical protein [Candidatus Pacearchaeota archaeon]
MNNKNAFWQALIFTIIIFVVGFIFGFFLEVFRGDKMELVLLNSEINLLDEQLRANTGDYFNITCNETKEGLFNFADRIYYEAIKLEKYENSERFSETLFLIHKRYDLLRMMLWSESIKAKKECTSDFHTVVYLYEYDIEDLGKQSKQVFFSRLLFDLKTKNPDKILLIPLAVNTELDSVNLSVRNYNISTYPVIIVDEKKIFIDVIKFDDFEREVLGSK